MSLDVFNLHAKIDLDTREYTDGISKAKGMMSSLGGAVKTSLTAVASMSATAVAGAASGVAALTKSAVSAYGEYEQLVGGVDKLYGEASQKLQDYAADAYKTSGLSANEYMSQATSFSAALINSLDGDTARAAELTDVAMRAISDNFNTFGSDIQSVQNAYQGFAKQNYTINLMSAA